MIPFTLNVKTLATANLAFQILLIFTASVASYFAINKDFKRHCALIRIAVIFQVIIVAAFMLPSMTGYLKIGILPNLEMLIHHTLGLLVIILWIYINLVMGKLSGDRKNS